MPKKHLRRHVVWGSLMWIAFSLIGSVAEAQDRSKLEEPPPSRSAYVVDHEAVFSGLRLLLQSRGIRNPLFVVDGHVVRGSVQLYVRQYNIECMELRPGRTATLEFQRGASDASKDGVLLIWTRNSVGPKPTNCRIPY